MLARLVTIGGVQPTVGVLGSVRRLVFIAQSLAVADMKQQVDGPSESQKKELAPAEREARLTRQRNQLVGLTLNGELECAHVCYDHVLTMLEKNTIVYLEPSKFPSRRAELASEKLVKEITLDSSKTLKLADKKQELSCETHSELLLIQALQRRALALDLVGVASYAEVEKYNTFLTMHLQTPPPQDMVKSQWVRSYKLTVKLGSGLQKSWHKESEDDPTTHCLWTEHSMSSRRTQE